MRYVSLGPIAPNNFGVPFWTRTNYLVQLRRGQGRTTGYVPQQLLLPVCRVIGFAYPIHSRGFLNPKNFLDASSTGSGTDACLVYPPAPSAPGRCPCRSCVAAAAVACVLRALVGTAAVGVAVVAGVGLGKELPLNERFCLWIG